MVRQSGSLQGVTPAASLVRDAAHSLVAQSGVLDLAFIGSASELYEWKPSRIVDFDFFIFANELGRALGDALERMRQGMASRLDAMGVDFELRIIRGPYKPERTSSDRPIVLAHLGVFTDETYRTEAPTKRWSWRKYPCVVERHRLMRLSPRSVDLRDLLEGPEGVEAGLRDLIRGVTLMEEWILPELRTEVRSFDATSHVFVEFCHASVSTCARHHARVLGYTEPDRLSNEEFFPWYDRQVLSTSSLLPLAELKRRSRDEGFGSLGSSSRKLAIAFLGTLSQVCRDGLSVPGP
jgi:hypothetical protein